MSQAQIRNFCIIAHIDHGKSTLADRMMELTGTVDKRDMKSQLLDSMELEREKGITIKLTPVSMKYQYREHGLSDVAVGSRQGNPAFGSLPDAVASSHDNSTANSLHSAGLASLRQSSSGQESAADLSGLGKASGKLPNAAFELNLIDTPGHVDFSYEVSRSLQACEGAVLVVDASQGIQAQTLASTYLAMGADLTIIPVLNKIDLPAADVPRVSAELVNLLGCSESDILQVSAKTGQGVGAVLGAVVERVAPPSGDPDAPLRALIFDSYYDDYRGVILYVRVVDGQLAKNAKIRMMATASDGLALEIGRLAPDMKPTDALNAGEIGYIVTNLKTTREARVGDTVTLQKYFD